MDAREQKMVLDQLETMRKRLDAFFIIGIRDGDFFYVVDDMVSADTVEKELKACAAHIAASIRRKRAGGPR